MVQNFATLKSREAINEHIATRYQDILHQYSKELDEISSMFSAGKAEPPIYKNYPPVSGAIAWARSLYMRAKKTIVKFKSAGEGLLDSPYGTQVKARYLDFARQVDAYVHSLFDGWQVQAQEAVSKLTEPLFVAEGLPLPPPGSSHLSSSQSRHTGASSTRATSGAGKRAGGNVAGGGFVMPPPPYGVNFGPDILAIINESRCMDAMQFEVPPGAISLTLQSSQLGLYALELQGMLKRLHAVLDDLSPIETELLKEQRTELQNVLKAGFTTYNWTSQRIHAFADLCKHAITTFEAKLDAVHSHSQSIEQVLEHIAKTKLVTLEDLAEVRRPMTMMSFVDFVEGKKRARLAELQSEYATLTPLLIKVEEEVASTNSGSSPLLKEYYEYWEGRVYNAVVEMVVSNLANLRLLLTKSDGPSSIDVGAHISVHATFNGKDVQVTPPLNSVFKALANLSRGMAESSQTFGRWMYDHEAGGGTCLEAPPVQLSEDEEHRSTFWQDVSQNEHVVRLMLSVNRDVHACITDMDRYLDEWRRYDTVHDLWNPKRKQQMEKIAKRDPSVVFFDTRMGLYASFADLARATVKQTTMSFLSIDCSALASEVAHQATDWKRDYGLVLYHASKERYDALRHKMDQQRRDISTQPNDLDALKFVLNTIAAIEAQLADQELLYLDIIQRYYTIQHHGITVDAEETVSVAALPETTRQLFIDAKTTDLRLVEVKDRFRLVTQEQTVAFSEELAGVKRDFLDGGPGISGDLDRGVLLCREYEAKVRELIARKGGLVNAETLFGLDITPYPALNLVAGELEQLTLIYALYSEQAAFQDSMSTTLWGELDILKLQQGAEVLEKKTRKFPKNLQENTIFKDVQATIFGFKDSLPLIVNLKNDAMQPRHWGRLMEVTGTSFEYNPKTLTLGSIFAMQLSRFTESIEEIINEAVQELKIQNEIRRVEHTWSAVTMKLAKYTKNGVDRGYTLLPADEIKLELEDTLLNLQTMSGSRFIGEFADAVKNWEKALNLVNECMDVWFQVQRKWMYLESIFIGAEDIRLQLPEEAKKFDSIDKTYR